MRKTLLIHIDGCRADTLAAASTPAIDALMENGAWTLNARTVSPSVTLPVHFSVFTSLGPVSHGVLSNGANPNVSGSAMGMVQWFRSLGKTTAMYYNWEYLRELSPPGYLDRSIFLDTALTAEGDMTIARAAAPDIIEAMPDFAFIYLGCPDEVGHASGYESDTYLRSIERADAAVGHILDALAQKGVQRYYTILFQSDHGGVGHDHTAPVPEVLTVPWVLSGSGVRPGEIEHPVSVTDTAPTLAQCMGIVPHPFWQGRIVSEALDSSVPV